VSYCAHCIQVSYCTHCIQVSYCTHCIQVSYCTHCSVQFSVYSLLSCSAFPADIFKLHSFNLVSTEALFLGFYLVCPLLMILCRGNWHGDIAIKELNLDEESDSDYTAQLQAFKLEVSQIHRLCCFMLIVCLLAACAVSKSVACSILSYRDVLLSSLHSDLRKYFSSMSINPLSFDTIVWVMGSTVSW